MIDDEGIIILTNTTKITDDMFEKIKKIIIHESLEGISCKKIFNFSFPILSIKLKNLEEVDFSNCTFDTIMCCIFVNCKKLKSIELPKTIKIFKSYCFAYCEQLESVILHGVEEIGYYAFKKCISLKYLFISDTIKEINENAFSDIPKEQEITIICPDRFYNYFKERFPNASINEKDYLLK